MLKNIIGSTDFRVPRRPIKAIEDLAGSFGRLVAPGRKAGESLDVVELVDHALQREEIDVYPAREIDLSNEWGGTSFEGGVGARKIVLLREVLFDALLDPSSKHFNIARATVAHELGHAVLHVEYLRRRSHQGMAHLLQRQSSSGMMTIERSEWQAWCFGTCLLAPRAGIESLGPSATIGDLARHFGVSRDLMNIHLDRLKIHRSSH